MIREFCHRAGHRQRALSLLVFLVLIPTATSVAADDVIPKVGDRCPTGYCRSGDYCKAFSSSDDAESRVIGNPAGGKCPVGWYRSGDYCKAYGKRADEAVVEKVGDKCPSGMYKSGGFCKSYR
jgi:hypothetical protein